MLVAETIQHLRNRIARIERNTPQFHHDVLPFGIDEGRASSAELPDYAAGRAGAQPMATTSCGAGSDRAAGHTTRASTAHRKS